MNNQIFVVVDGKKEGPYSNETVALMVSSGVLNSDSQCWHEGLIGWSSLKEVFPELMGKIPPPLYFDQSTSNAKTLFNLAALSDRFIAGILDFFILTIIGVIFAFVIPFVGGFLVLAIYLIFPMSNSQFQGTLGMRVMGLKIVDVNGCTLSIATAFLRFIASVFSMFIFGIGYFIVFFSEKSQTLHDKVAGTYVVKR